MNRDPKDTLMVEGARAVETMLEHFPHRVRELWHMGELKGRRAEIVDTAKAGGILVHKKNRAQFQGLSAEANHQGLALVVEPQGYSAYTDLLADPSALLMAFDQVTDPRNLGAALRSAEALGATGGIITKNRCARLGPTVCKTSVGASEILPVAMETNLARSLRVARDAGIKVLGTAFDGQPPASFDFTQPTLIVVGSEERGIRPSTLAQCDGIITIPMTGKTASLNASVAASIVLYEAMRQRMFNKH